MTKVTNKQKLMDYCTKALEKVGVGREDAVIAAEVLSTNDMRGVNSHGTTLLRNYIRQIKAGGIDPAAQAETVTEAPAWALIDGHCGLGVLTSYKAMKVAIEKARQSGIGMVCVRGSNHAAATGYYAMMCAEENMIGIAMSNGDPVMSIPGTKGRVIGNNPFAYAVPAGNQKAVFFDVAMSVIAGGKIKNFEIEGKKLPENWMVDKNGMPTTDPSIFRQGGTLLPFALHKGYGFAVMVECLAAILSGSGFTKQNVDWTANPERQNNVGHMFIAIDIQKLIPADTFNSRMDLLVEELHNAQKSEGTERIFVPGEIELENEAKAVREGIKPGMAVYKNLSTLANDLGMEEEFKGVFIDQE